MSKRKDPENTYWRGNTLWGRISVAGREIRWSLRTSDAEVAASRVEARRQQEVAAAHYGDARVEWGDALLAWAEHIPQQAAPSTITRYMVSIRQLEPFLKGMFLDEIDKRVVAEIVRKRRAKGVTTATIRRDLTALSSVLGFCMDEEWRDDNPALTRLQRLKERRDPIVLPDPAHIRRVIERAPGNMAKLIEAAWLTGCRQDELVSLQRRQLDHSLRQITIVGKGRKLRTIALSDEAYEVFRSLPVNLATRHVFWHSAANHYANISSRFRVIVKSCQEAARKERAEFRPFRFHDLRHRFAVDFLKSGRGTIYTLQQTLGHSSVTVTEIYLAHLTPEEAHRAKFGDSQKAAHIQRFENDGSVAG